MRSAPPGAAGAERDRRTEKRAARREALLARRERIRAVDAGVVAQRRADDRERDALAVDVQALAHILAQRLQEIFALVGNAAAQQDPGGGFKGPGRPENFFLPPANLAHNATL